MNRWNKLARSFAARKAGWLSTRSGRVLAHVNHHLVAVASGAGRLAR